MTRPVVQLAAAAVVMLVGAWLVGWWLVGLVLVLQGALIAVDAVLRDDGRDGPGGQGSVGGVLERYRRAR